ncbi:MAG: lysophospholipid acyltransferase family protein [Pseudomonadota bacterium]|nr:lysophospholipid acyltransferase family protein [Pseudomonadota bacterium]
MKSLLRHPFVSSTLGYLIWGYMVLCARTIRWTVEGEEQFRAEWNKEHGLVVAAWHSRVLLLPTIWSRIARRLPAKAYPTSMLISLSRDGEAVAKAIEHLGLDSVRGSSTHKRKRKDKGGVAALAETSRRLRSGSVVCITPDGPRGPATTVQPGAVLLAQRTGAAIMPYALSVKPVWRLNTWDRFMIPLPFSKGAMVIGSPVKVSKTDSVEHGQAATQSAMAEAYARARELTGQPAAEYE